MKRLWAPLLVALGWLSLALGFLGLFLPVLPTTPFVLLSAYCFSRGSRRMHAWLLGSRLFGPLIVDWERDGVIRPRTKAIALGTMALLFGYMLAFVPVRWPLKLVVLAVGVAVATFILTRPSAPRSAG